MKTCSHTNTNGFAMLEVLISILVIAFGLLGLAGLQGTSIRNNHGAYLRSQATLYAYDIADRIRANRVGFDNGNYNLGTAADTAACHPSSSPTGCTPAEMAGYDLSTWNSMLAQLPGGQGIVCIDSTVSATDTDTFAAPGCDGTGIQYVAKIWWNEAGTVTPPFNVVFQP